MDLPADLVLLTGATGWLGRNLIDALVGRPADGEDFGTPPELALRALVLPDQQQAGQQIAAQGVEVVPGDVRRAEDCRRLCQDARGALLVHAAAAIHPRRVRDFHAVNVEGTKNVLDAAIAAGVRRAVVLSSNTPCGFNHRPEHLFDEQSPYRPYGKYGWSKTRMELAVRERQRAGRMETVVIRAPWFYGPHQPPRQTLFFQMVRDGKMPIVGGGNNRRSMVYVGNLVEGLLLAAASPAANGQTFWIADERPYTINEIVDTVERLLETEFAQRCAHRRRRLPGVVSRVARLATHTLQALGLHQRNIHVLSEMDQTIACSIAKARAELGYAPRVGLEEGMRRSLRWLAENSDPGGFLP